MICVRKRGMRYKRAPLPCNAVSKMPFILLFLFIPSFLLGASSIWWRGRTGRHKIREGREIYQSVHRDMRHLKIMRRGEGSNFLSKSLNMSSVIMISSRAFQKILLIWFFWQKRMIWGYEVSNMFRKYPDYEEFLSPHPPLPFPSVLLFHHFQMLWHNVCFLFLSQKGTSSQSGNA